MTTDITELAQRLKAAAEKATPGQWVAFTHADSRTFSVHTPDDKRCGDVIKWAGFDGQRKAKANAEFIALANPSNVKRLVEALEKAQHEAAVDWEAAASLNVENQELKRRIAELESRTVKLPPRAPENLACCLDGYEKWLIATTFRDTWNKCLDEVMRTGGTGIKWEGE